MPNYKPLIDQLVKDGWSTDDVVTTIENMDKEYNSLLNSPDDPDLAADRIAKMGVISNGKHIPLFPTAKPVQPEVSEREIEIPPTTNLAGKAAAIPQISTPVTKSINPGGLTGETLNRNIAEGLTKIIPFSGAIRAFGGIPNAPKDLGTILNPLPDILSEILHAGTKGIKDVTGLDVAKDVEAAMSMAPFMTGRIPKITDVSTGSKLLTERLTPRIAPGSPTVNAPASTASLPLTTGAASSIINPSAKISETPSAVNPLVINQAKELKDISTKLGDQQSVVAANNIINNNGLIKPEEIMTGRTTIDSLVNKEKTVSAGDVAADLNFIYNDPLISSDFGYKKIIQDRIKVATASPEIIGNKAVNGKAYADTSTGLTQEKAIAKTDFPDYKAEEYLAGDAIIKRAIAEKTPALADLKYDVREYMDMLESENRKLREMKSQIPSEDMLSNLKENNLEIQANAIVKPYSEIMLKIEADTGIPMFNEFHYKGRINYNNKMDFTLAERAKIDAMYGKYKLPYDKYIKGRERISDILEDIKSYNSYSHELVYKNPSGKEVTGTISDASKARKWNYQETEIAANLREYYDGASERGAPIPANKYIDYYNPKRHENSPELRAKYFENFRNEERPFFSFHRTGEIPNEPWIRDSKALVERYISEWGTVNNMMSWQNDIAKPLLDLVRQWENKGANALSTDKPARYVEKYIKDVMGIPRDNGADLNYTIFKVIRDHIEPHAPKIAKDLYSWLSKDRTGEMLSSKLLGQYYKNVLGYRPVKMARNFNQRIMATPLLPRGLIDIGYGMKELRTQAGQDKVLSSGILGYVGDMVEKGFSDRYWSAMRGWEAIEKGNRGSIYLSLHDGLIKDYQNKLSVSDMAKKYHLNLYHEVIANKIKKLYSEGKIGDVREYGKIDNAAHYLGDTAQMMTQYWYDKGSGIELFNQGPLWKQVGAFSSYAFLTHNYLANLLRASYKSPKDLARIAKMFAYVTTVDNIIYNATGINFQSNPLTNLPSQLAGGPAATGTYGAYQMLSGHYNNLMSNIFKGREDEYAKLQAAEGFRKVKSSARALTPAIISAPMDLYQFFNPKETKSKSIAP